MKAKTRRPAPLLMATPRQGVLFFWTPLYLELTFKSLAAFRRWSSWGTLETGDANPVFVPYLWEELKKQEHADLIGDSPFVVVIGRQSGKIVIGPLKYNIRWNEIKARAAALRARIRGVR